MFRIAVTSVMVQKRVMKRVHGDDVYDSDAEAELDMDFDDDVHYQEETFHFSQFDIADLSDFLGSTYGLRLQEQFRTKVDFSKIAVCVVPSYALVMMEKMDPHQVHRNEQQRDHIKAQTGRKTQHGLANLEGLRKTQHGLANLERQNAVDFVDN